MQEIEIEYATKKQKLELIEENIQKIENRLNKVKQEGQEIEVNKKNLVTKKQEYIKQIDTLTCQIERIKQNNYRVCRT